MNLERLAWWQRALLAAAVHLVLLAIFPLLRPAYAPFFRAFGELGVRTLDPLPGPIEAHFAPGSGGPLARDHVAMDTIVTLEHPELTGRGSFGASSLFHGWWPTSVLCALLWIATPCPRRLGGTLLALAGLHLFIVLRCALAAFYCHAKSSVDGQPLVPLSPAAERALFLAWHFGWDEMLANYLVPLVLWSLFALGVRSPARPSNG
jgi:hypothetical protein